MRTAPRRSLAALAATALVTASVLAAAPAAFAADDTTPPVVTIQAPADGVVFDGSGAWVTFTTSDDVAILGWEVLIDGAHFYSGTSAGQVGVNLFVGHIPNGPHSVTVKALDTSSNETSVTRSFTVDYVGPDVQIVSPQEGAWVRADHVSIGYQGTDSLAWTVRADDTVVRSDSGYSGITFGFDPVGWADGSTHTIEVTGQDPVGRSTTRSVTFRADGSGPEVSLDALPAVLARSGVLSGTVTDASSGVASVQVSFATRVDESCGGVAFGAAAAVTGGTWSLAMPASASDGEYCVTVRATDVVGNTSDTLPAHVSLDVTGPAAPTGLAPTGELLDPPSALSWTAVSDAVSYQYRISSDPWAMESATPVDVATASATLPTPLTGTSFWQVRGIDALGNIGDWSTVADVTVLGAPELATCPALCRIVSDTLHVAWNPFSSAVGYRVQVTGADAAGHPVVFEQDVDGSESETDVTLPADFPTGTITVRLRAELDHEVGGSTLTDWSEPLNYLRFAAPGAPTLLSPGAGAYVDGDNVSLAWTDDSSVVLWELRISPTSDVDEDGGLVNEEGGTGLPLLDPMFIVMFLVGEADDVPDGIRLDDIDALADCQAMLDLLGSLDPEGDLDVPCADGAFTIPATVPDGSYFWQVRGISFASLNSAEEPGPWSSLGRFTVGDAPVIPQPGGNPSPSGSKPHGTPATTETTGDEPVAETVDEPSDAPSDAPEASEGSGSGSGGDAEAGPSTDDAGATSDDGFPVGWLIGGIVVLVVLAGGGAFLGLRLRRG